MIYDSFGLFRYFNHSGTFVQIYQMTPKFLFLLLIVLNYLISCLELSEYVTHNNEIIEQKLKYQFYVSVE